MILSAGRTVKEVKDLTCEDIFEADAATPE
jgi:hypothetical protein